MSTPKNLGIVLNLYDRLQVKPMELRECLKKNGIDEITAWATGLDKAAGMYFPITDTIGYRTSRLFKRYFTLLHELTHWAAHHERTNQSPLNNVSYSGMSMSSIPERTLHTEEMTAQWGAYFLSVRLGLPEVYAKNCVDSYRRYWNNANEGTAIEQAKIRTEYILKKAGL